MNAEKIISKKALSVDLGAIREMFEKANKMTDVVSLGIGEPDLDTHPDICKACSDALGSGFTHYAPNAGMPQLRRAISQSGFVSKHKYDPDSEIIVTNGGMGAFALIMQVVLEKGDEVLIADPQYLNFITNVEYCGGTVVRVPTRAEDGFCMRAETIRALYKKGKTKMLIINSPNNPTGEVATARQLEEIAKVACELDLLVVSDEVYSGLIYDTKATSISDFEGMRGRTIIVNSFSKGYAMTGWRIGYAAGPSEIISRMVKVQEYFNSCINTSAQLGAVYALEHPEINEEIRRSFAERRKLTLDAINSIGKIHSNSPKGAFYLFPDISGFGMDSETFCNRLLEEAGVVCIPGSAFGKCGEGHIRISYSTKKDKLEIALERLKRFCEKL